jgi:hypothetical protein
MELSAFGAVIKFAMDREEDVAARVTALAGDDSSSLGELGDEIRADARKSVGLLERTRREHVNELVLEPVVGLESSDYELQELPSSGLTGPQAFEHLARTLDTMIRFYTEAAARITNPEAKRTFGRIAKAKARLRARIQ